MNQDKIYMNQLQFYGYHGMLLEEQRLGQPFVVDIIIYTQMDVVAQSDRMEDGVHYGHVYEVVQTIIEGPAYQLLEALTTAIADAILRQFNRIDAVTVKVSKPQAPIVGQFHSVAVERTLNR